MLAQPNSRASAVNTPMECVCANSSGNNKIRNNNNRIRNLITVYDTITTMISKVWYFRVQLFISFGLVLLTHITQAVIPTAVLYERNKQYMQTNSVTSPFLPSVQVVSALSQPQRKPITKKSTRRRPSKSWICMKMRNTSPTHIHLHLSTQTTIRTWYGVIPSYGCRRVATSHITTAKEYTSARGVYFSCLNTSGALQERWWCREIYRYREI